MTAPEPTIVAPTETAVPALADGDPAAEPTAEPTDPAATEPPPGTSTAAAYGTSQQGATEPTAEPSPETSPIDNPDHATDAPTSETSSTAEADPTSTASIEPLDDTGMGAGASAAIIGAGMPDTDTAADNPGESLALYYFQPKQAPGQRWTTATADRWLSPWRRP